MTAAPAADGSLELVVDAAPVAERNADLLWDVFAAAVAARPLVRVSRDGGVTYPRSTQRRLAQRPAAPAAVPLHDPASATGRVLLVDLDVSRGGLEQVLRDCEHLSGLLQWCGLGFFVDESPAGGRHVYVPWAQPVPFEDLRAVARVLERRLPSLDVKPNLGLTDGLVRPPGAAHKSGGFQTLVTPYAEARAVLLSPNGPEAWADLVDLLGGPAEGGELTVPAQRSSAPDGPGGDVVDPATLPVGTRHAAAAGSKVPQLRQRRPLPKDVDALARTGSHPSDPHKYATPSDARQAVLTAAAARGWSYEDVCERLSDGSWTGVADGYARYSPQVRQERQAYDWLRAVCFAAQLSYAHNSTTRDSNHTPPGMDPCAAALALLDAHGFLRAWWSAYESAARDRYAGKAGLACRLALRAVVDAAQKAGTRWAEFGSRSLSLAVPAADSTLRAALQVLRDEADPLLILVRPGRGLRGDLYELRIPDGYRTTARWRPWRSGRLGGMHPVWRVLGAIPGQVYELLDIDNPTSSLDLAARTGYSPRAVQQALAVLHEHQLTTGGRRGWSRGQGDLDVLAVNLGAIELTQARRDRYRAQRQAWWAELARRAAVAQASVLTVADILRTPQSPDATDIDTPLPWQNLLHDVAWWEQLPEREPDPNEDLYEAGDTLPDPGPSASLPLPQSPPPDDAGADAAAERLDDLVERMHIFEQQRSAANTVRCAPTGCHVDGVSSGDSRSSDPVTRNASEATVSTGHEDERP